MEASEDPPAGGEFWREIHCDPETHRHARHEGRGGAKFIYEHEGIEGITSARFVTAVNQEN
jgi:hypothetical protein